MLQRSWGERLFAKALLLASLMLAVSDVMAQASLELTAPGGTTFTSPSGFDLMLVANDGSTGNTFEQVEFYWLTRNGDRIDFDQVMPSRIYHESGLPSGVYQYSLEGRAMYRDARGNERYKSILPIPRLTVTVLAGYGGITASASSCTIPWGQSSCPVTINWTSNAPAAQVFMSALDNSNMQLVGQGQSGAITASVTPAGQRFHLRNGAATFATTEARGIATVNQAPTISIATPTAGAMFPAGASVPISASAADSDDGVGRVDLKVDGTTVASLTSPPYSTRLTTLAPGTHTVTATAIDTRGTSTTSAPVSISVSTIPGTTLTRRYVYDSHQRLCKSIEPETGSTVMGYDAAGNLAWSAAGLDLPSTTSCDLAAAEASGRAVRRTYDARNRIATLRFPDRNGDVDYQYTPDGLVQQTTAYNDSGTTTATSSYQYNKLRLLSGESLAQTGATTRSIGYGYSPNGHLAGQTYPSGRYIDYAPNAMGQATRAGDYASGVSYYPNGGIKQFTYGNGVVHTTTQNARRLPWRSVDSNIIGFETTLDANGNVIAIADLQLGATYGRQMQYDDRNRLIAAGSAMFGGDGWHRFSYDALDNIRSWSLGGVKADQYWFDAKNRLTNVRNEYGATTAGLSYDLQGNLHTKNGREYSFDYGNRLRAVVGSASYRYNAAGLRVLSTDSNGAKEESFYSTAGQLLSEIDELGGSFTETIYLSGSAIVQLQGSTVGTAVVYQHTDPQGSPTASSGPSGQLLQRTHYEPYGKPINRVVDGIGYAGHKMDADIDLSYMQQRYYDPNLARFLSADPESVDLGSGRNFNRFKYGNNSPYTFVDPDGRAESPYLMRLIIPGQVTWDNGVTAAEQGDYPMAIALGATAIAEAGMAVVTLGQGSAIMNSSRAVAQEIAAVSAARNAAQAARNAKAEGGAVAGLVTEAGEVFTGASTKAGGPGIATNRTVSDAAEQLAQSERSAVHGCCAEINAMSNAANAGAKLKGSRLATVRVSGGGKNKLMTPCATCQAVADKLGVVTVSPPLKP
ncbi:RHS repeat-associated core domain-containing protein [Stenotrophomonas oahuensis]|uniref:Ig-like domain-containing protein n=1 Tax=Stenotrophomonas oahuensis TaxID=3003271 RepID=A0ABY9YN20_9GAMM|nr:RHS repeat-associated core domain-containing protein [Stenotrophomonas sp. A5586]WNH52266.1 Ig-like domain-containing protein [Stenotrophomonas sp. A5586]